MTTPLRSPATAAVFAGIGLASLLAGCSSAATADPAAAPSSSTKPTTSSSPASSPAAVAGNSYTDGSYTEQGSYSSPGGRETVSVQLTLASDTVTAVTVKTVKADPTATQYEALFIANIDKVVVGKKIDELNVHRVGGSSLTSEGFSSAVAKIKADAKA